MSSFRWNSLIAFGLLIGSLLSVESTEDTKGENKKRTKNDILTKLFNFPGGFLWGTKKNKKKQLVAISEGIYIRKSRSGFVSLLL